MVIKSFRGEYNFLSNFFMAPCGIYPSSENYYQAHKSKNKYVRDTFLNISPSQAKALGKTVELRKDWETVKEHVMLRALQLKFRFTDMEDHNSKFNHDLAERLIHISGATIVEGNTWHDNYWGDCHCRRCINIEGKNRLGILLMKRQSELIDQMRRKNASFALSRMRP